jgi:hypothetical protein
MLADVGKCIKIRGAELQNEDVMKLEAVKVA